MSAPVGDAAGEFQIAGGVVDHDLAGGCCPEGGGVAAILVDRNVQAGDGVGLTPEIAIEPARGAPGGWTNRTWASSRPEDLAISSLSSFTLRASRDTWGAAS